MIRLQRQPMPEPLATEVRERSDQFRQLLAAGAKIPDALLDAYKIPPLKQHLRVETGDKCAYCESKIPHVDYGDVEHILAKDSRPELRLTYENLTYACSVCNTKKGKYFDEKTPLLNPFIDEPQEHLFAAGPMVLRKPTSDRGHVTQKRLELNRMALIEKRAERLEAMAGLIDQATRTENPGVREVLLDQIAQECASDKEYAFIVRAYVKQAMNGSAVCAADRAF
jgi:5-methylcytosine-specific restriction endonuclease McrA